MFNTSLICPLSRGESSKLAFQALYILVPGEEWFREGAAGGGFVNLSDFIQIYFDKIRLKCK
jgi:hypothetical protein